ncbi:MAG: hypothetical protein V7K38_09785 [Nostoc sp.]
MKTSLYQVSRLRNLLHTYGTFPPKSSLRSPQKYVSHNTFISVE